MFLTNKIDYVTIMLQNNDILNIMLHALSCYEK